MKPLSLATLDAHMIAIQGGEFDMGGESVFGDEKPIHRVRLDNFSLCRYPVTQQVWREVMSAAPSRFTGADRPVEQVSWDDCQAFLQQLNTQTGQHYRLPTEAEWEYAARGGGYGPETPYAGSADLDEVGWYNDNSYGETQPVGLRAPNALGLYDLSGNVWEWCQDWYGNYPAGAQDNPTGPDSGGSRVYRGGSWNIVAADARGSFRFHWLPDRRNDVFGCRLARSF